MLETLYEIIATIRRNMMRTIATGFSVVSGLFLLIVLQGAGNGVINSFLYNMGDFAFDAVRVYGGITTMPFRGNKEGRFIKMNQKDVEMARKSFPKQVSSAMGVLNQEGQTASRGERYVSSTTLKGVEPAFAPTQAVKMLEGRFINEIDIAQRRKVVVVGHNNVKNLFAKGETALGEMIQIGGVLYTVVGIYKTNEMNNNSDFYAPQSTVRAIYARGPWVDELTMNVHDIPTEEAMEKFTDEYVKATSQIHSFHPEDKRALWIWNQAVDNIKTMKAERILHLSFWILGLLTMLSGVVGVSNIMLISVKERTHEFGIRRAIGARPWNIIRMVMMESVIITGVFGYIGMWLGVAFCEMMDSTVGNQRVDLGFAETRFFVNPTVDISVCIYATIIIIVAGALAGFFPARKAVRIKPIDALRG